MHEIISLKSCILTIQVFGGNQKTRDKKLISQNVINDHFFFTHTLDIYSLFLQDGLPFFFFLSLEILLSFIVVINGEKGRDMTFSCIMSKRMQI